MENQKHDMHLGMRLQPVETSSCVIRAYMMQYVESSKGRAILRRCRERPGLKERILDSIQNQAKGSFRAAELCLLHITNHDMTLEAIKGALERLPKSVNAAYTELIKSLSSRSPDDRIVSRKALTWVAVAKRSLAVEGLGQALALRALDDIYDGKNNRNHDFFDKYRIPDPKDIVANTRGLLAKGVDLRSGESHYTMHLTLHNYIQKQQEDEDRGSASHLVS